MIDNNFLIQLRDQLPESARAMFDNVLAVKRKEYEQEGRIEKGEVDWERMAKAEEEAIMGEVATPTVMEQPQTVPTVPQVPSPTDMMGSPKLPQDMFGTVPTVPQDQTVPTVPTVPMGTAAPRPPAPEVFPETQEMLNVNMELSNELDRLNAPFEFAKSGRPMPTEPDPSLFTEEDWEAGRQLLRGEQPTANVEKWKTIGNAVRFRDSGGDLDGQL